MNKYILALDQGTTSSRAIVFDNRGRVVSQAQKEFRQIFPESGWVEHDPGDIWTSQASVIAEAITRIGINGKHIAAIGITNQRETTIVWDRKSGEPVYNAIVWQDRRTSAYCDTLKKEGYSNLIREKTGLVIDAYFSASKIKWILDNIKGAREKAEKGRLAFGTIDSWLVWKLTSGSSHITDITNASRTMLFNIKECCWDKELLDIFNIPETMLPEVKASSEISAHTKTTIFAHEIPVGGIAGDQQAALFGQLCIEPGMAKNTYGTGCFMLMNTGPKLIYSENRLISTIAWKIGDKVSYALEGSIFIAGAAVQWLRDQLGIIENASDIEKLALSVEDNGGLYFVPALSGLGAPHWDQYARGTMLGITRGSSRGHFARATLEGIAFQVMDVLRAMEADSGIRIKELRVDGGAAANNLLLQFQSEILQSPVVRPRHLETTALGAAYLAGLASGFWKNAEELGSHWKTDREFRPALSEDKVTIMINKWQKALSRSLSWEEE